MVATISSNTAGIHPINSIKFKEDDNLLTSTKLNNPNLNDI